MKTLRLSGEVKPEVFTKLLQGYHPIGGEPTTAIVENAGDEGRRGGSDFTFSAPKSVSLLSFKDERIQTAFDTAVRYALDYLQSEIQVRHKHNGVVSIEKTGKAVFAVFNHATTRPPEEYGAPDPQLHAHCVMANITFDAKEQARSIHNPFTPEKIHLGGQYFRNALAKEIQKLGYQINITDRTEGFFQIKKVPDEIIKDFSRRSEQIKEKVKELRELRYKDITDETLLKKWAIERVGTTDPAIVQAEIEELKKSEELVYAKKKTGKLSSKAAIETRKPKKDVSRKDIIEHIDEILKEYGTTLERLTADAQAEGEKPHEPPSSIDAEKAVSDAIEEATKTEAAFTRDDILNKALKSTLGGHVTPDAIFNEFDRRTKSEDKADDSKIISLFTKPTEYGETAYYSTSKLIEMERENIETCVKTCAESKTDIVIDSKIVDEYIDRTQKTLISESTDGHGFTEGQIDALRHILTTNCQYSVIQGYAGTGKSFSIRFAKELLEKQGYKVCGIAPTGKATDELTVAAEIETTMTIASLISTKEKPFERGKKYCVIVDETSMSDSRTVNELLKVTQEYGAKVIFVGDKDQFQPVGAGKFFSDLQKTDIKITKMKDVIRQKTTQTKSVVKALADKKIPDAINILAGYAVVDGYDKINAKKYNIGQRISFHDRTATANSDVTVPPGTTAHVTAVGDTELTVEYTVRGQKITVNIDPRKTHKNYTLYEKNKGYKDCLYTIADKDARQQAVADDYVNCYRKGTDAIVITATNEDRRSLNKIIRETLVSQEKIRNVGDFTLLEPKNVKNFLFADSFAVGQQVKGLPQLRTDGEYGFGEITNIDLNQNKITVRNPKTNEEFKVDPSDYVKKQFSVFDKTSSALGVGEKITFLKNARVIDQNTGKTVNLRNGQLATITALDQEGNITVKVDKKEIKINLNDYNYITTAFALSLHKSQGMTVDKVIWHADTSKEVSTNSFYVAITRCKRDIAVYTDDIERLQIKASKGQDKYSTIDFDEVYDKAYQKHIKTIQRRNPNDVTPEIATAPEAAPSTQETAPPPPTTTATAVPLVQAVKPPTTVKAPPPTAHAPAVQTAKPRTEYSLKKIDGYNLIPLPNENLRKLSDETIIKLTLPPKDCDTFDAIKANINKMGLNGFFSTKMLKLWKSNLEKKNNAYKAGTQAMRCVIAAARALQTDGVSVDKETKQGKTVRSITFKPDNDGCFGLDVVKGVGKDGKPLYAVIMKYPDRNEFARKKEHIESWSQKKLPILRMDGKQVKIAGYLPKNGVDIKLNVKTSEWVYKDEKAIFPTIRAALQACIPKRIQHIVLSAIRNIREENGYSDAPEPKTPKMMKSRGFSLTGDD